RLLTPAVLYRSSNSTARVSKRLSHRSAACLRPRYCIGHLTVPRALASGCLIGRPLAYARGTVSVIEGENINEFVRQKNNGRNIRHGGFDALALHFGAVVSRARFSEREERLRFQMRGLPRE